MSGLPSPNPLTERPDRTSPMWQRLRAACQYGAWYVDLDDHVDRVYRTILSLRRERTA